MVMKWGLSFHMWECLKFPLFFNFFKRPLIRSIGARQNTDIVLEQLFIKQSHVTSKIVFITGRMPCDLSTEPAPNGARPYKDVYSD